MPRWSETLTQRKFKVVILSSEELSMTVHTNREPNIGSYSSGAAVAEGLIKTLFFKELHTTGCCTLYFKLTVIYDIVCWREQG